MEETTEQYQTIQPVEVKADPAADPDAPLPQDESASKEEVHVVKQEADSAAECNGDVKHEDQAPIVKTEHEANSAADASGLKVEENSSEPKQEEDAAAQPTRKRRSKWEDAPAPEPAPEAVQDSAGNEDGGSMPPPPARRHKWGPPMDGSVDGDGKRKKKRSRWEEPERPSNAIVVAAPAGLAIGSFTFPKAVKLTCGLEVALPHHLAGDSTDPKIRALHQRLREVERRLEKGDLDIPPEGQRSPSPEPVYDRNGVRLNTREIRAREKLVDERHRLIEDLIKEDSTYKPPADYRPRKFQAKVRIPQDEYPTYNFIGLLIGPRGNTQKRMQQETNTKIAIRGKGSVKEGATKDPKYDYGEDEELHVLVTGNTQDDVDRAVAMIELLCRPDDDSLNEHKKLQLRELAALNGTLKDDVACPVCGEFTHRGWECPQAKQELYVLPENIKAQVEEQYKKDVARVRGAEALASEDDYKAFLQELGGAPPPELMGELLGGGARKGLGMMPRYGPEVPDECKLFVGSIPLTMSKEQLKAIFEPFGNVNHSVVVMDQATGQSRGFGFVHFDDPSTARTACEAMHGKMLEGKPLVVRVRSDPVDKKAGPVAHDNVNTVYVTALAPTVTEAMLRNYFETYGRVVECRLIVDRATGVSKGYAFVTMVSAREVQAAIQGANGYRLEGKAMVCKKAGPRSESGPGFGGPPGGGQMGGPPGGPGAGPNIMHPHHPAPLQPHPLAPHPSASAAWPPPPGSGAPPGAAAAWPPPPGMHPGAPPGMPSYPGYPPSAAYQGYGYPPPGAMYHPPPSSQPAAPYPYGAPGYPYAMHPPPPVPGAYPGQPPLPGGPGQPPLPAAPLPASYTYPPPSAAPPLPYAAQPPLPAGPAPGQPPLPAAPAPTAQQAQLDYEKFMRDLQAAGK